MAGTKKHRASALKIRRAREEGQVASSREVVHAVVLVCLVEATIAFADIWFSSLARVMSRGVESAAAGPDAWSRVAGDGMLVVLAVFAVLAVVTALAVATGLKTNGFLFAPKALSPKFERIDPVKNVQGLFNAQGLSNMALTLLKIVVVMAFGVFVLRIHLDDFARAWLSPVDQVAVSMRDLLLPLVRACELLFVVLSVVEFVVHRVMHAREMRMDDEEMRRDYKEANGDPLIKWSLRSLAREMVFEDPPEVDARQTADVVLANPTHVAVGLKYRRGVDDAPKVVFRHTDAAARTALAAASREGALVVRSPAFTRALFAACETGAQVPAAFIRPVAMVYRLLRELDASAAGRVVDVSEDVLLSAVKAAGRSG